VAAFQNLRTTVHDLLAAAAQDLRPADADVRRLNAAAAASPHWPELAVSDGAYTVSERIAGAFPASALGDGSCLSREGSSYAGSVHTRAVGAPERCGDGRSDRAGVRRCLRVLEGVDGCLVGDQAQPHYFRARADAVAVLHGGAPTTPGAAPSYDASLAMAQKLQETGCKAALTPLFNRVVKGVFAQDRVLAVTPAAAQDAMRQTFANYAQILSQDPHAADDGQASKATAPITTFCLTPAGAALVGLRRLTL